MCICDKNSDIFNFFLTFAYMEKEFVTMNRREWLKRSAAGLTALAVAGAVGGCQAEVGVASAMAASAAVEREAASQTAYAEAYGQWFYATCNIHDVDAKNRRKDGS